MNEYLVAQDGFDGVVQVVHPADLVLADNLLTNHVKVTANASKPSATICHKGKLT
jgi:hypothetical protein